MPELLGDERHYGVDELEQLLEEGAGGVVGGSVDGASPCGLDELEVPAAVVVPEELVDGHQGVGDAQLGVVVLHRLYRAREQAVEPFHGHCRFAGLRGVPVDLPSRDEPPRVPYLAAEVASLLDLRLVIEYVVAGGRA